MEEAEPSRVTAEQEQDAIHSLLFLANQAYLEDRYEEAAGHYESIVEAGHLNGHVFFNLGNTYVRLGELGRAILNYKKASVLLPRDGDLKANLQYARSLAKDRIEEPSPSLWNTLAFWYFGMNLGELLIALVIMNLLFWSSAIFNLYRSSEWAKWSLWLSLLLTLLLGASAGMKARESFRNAGGVLLEDEAPVRAGFSRNDTTLFVLHEGAEFTILDEEQGWWKIAIVDGKKGWLAAPSGGRVALTRGHSSAR
jgi:tetratricopeptide (TPR) repeat protein